MATFSLCPQAVEGTGELSTCLCWGLFYKRTEFHSCRLHPHDLISSQRLHLLIPAEGVRVSTHEFCRVMNIRSVTTIYKSNQKLCLIWSNFCKDQEQTQLLCTCIWNAYMYLYTFVYVRGQTLTSHAGSQMLVTSPWGWRVRQKKKRVKESIVWGSKLMLNVYYNQIEKKTQKTKSNIECVFEWQYWLPLEQWWLSTWIIFVRSRLLQHMNDSRSVSRKESGNGELC